MRNRRQAFSARSPAPLGAGEGALSIELCARKNQIRFVYEKSKDYRVIHADGVHGGISPSLDIRMAVFNEGAPLPKSTTNLINENGTLGAEDRNLREQEAAILREIETDIVMSVDVAKRLVEWLKGKINEAEEIVRRVKGK